MRQIRDEVPACGECYDSSTTELSSMYVESTTACESVRHACSSKPDPIVDDLQVCASAIDLFPKSQASGPV